MRRSDWIIYTIPQHLPLISLRGKDPADPGRRAFKADALLVELQGLVVPEFDLFFEGGKTARNGRVAGTVELPDDRYHNGKRSFDDLVPPFKLAADPYFPLLRIKLQDPVHESKLGAAEPGGDSRPHLCGIAVNGLLAAEDDPDLFCFAQLPDRFGQNIAGSQGICPSENAVGKEHRTVDSECKRLSERRLRVWRPH